MTIELATKKYTIAEFLALPKSERRYELVEGELVERADANEEHVHVSSNIQHYLSAFVRQNKLGVVYGADARYAIVPNSDTVRLADVSFVQTGRVQRGVVSMDFAPDLAVEVLSESNSHEAIKVTEEKVDQYFSHGGQAVWVVNLRKRELYLYRAGSNQRKTIKRDSTDLQNKAVVGEGVLTGFRLSLAQIFE